MAFLSFSSFVVQSELRESVTVRDALDVVDIMKESLNDVLADEFGHLDFRRGKGLSKSKQISVFMKVLHQKSKQRENAIFSQQELYGVAEEVKLQVDNFDSFIETLNVQNFLLRKGGNKFLVHSSSFSQL